MNTIPDTIDGIAEECISKLDKLDIEYFNSFSSGEDVVMQQHHGYGRHIRNEYKLWEKTHPLTKAWHQATDINDQTHIKNGVDYHPDHPDEISSSIIKLIWEKISKAKLQTSTRDILLS